MSNRSAAPVTETAKSQPFKLSGKFTRSAPDAPTRVNPGDISERDRGIAAEVDAVADELGVSSSQVALAWVMARRPLVHPIIGARRLDQLADNLAALQLSLPDVAAQRLDEVSAIELGFPHDSIESARSIFYGPVDERTDRRPPST